MKAFEELSARKGYGRLIVAYGQNGEAIRREQGYPLRLVVPGSQGVNNIKFVKSIKVVDKAYYLQPEISAYTNPKPNGQASWYEYSSRTEVRNHLPIGPA